MKYTRYFQEQVLRKRPYLKITWLKKALQKPARVEEQADGRKRYWLYVPALHKYLRVVALVDGTIHNAFPDRNFKKEEKL